MLLVIAVYATTTNVVSLLDTVHLGKNVVVEIARMVVAIA
jgi:hypothetical protein